MISDEFEAYGEEIKGLRNLLRRAEVNPRELLFERILECVKESDYERAAEKLGQIKKLLEQKLDHLLDAIVSAVRKEFGAGEHDSLKACLKEWQEKESKAAQQYILTATVQGFLHYLAEVETNDEHEIAARLSRVLLDVYVEDWTDDTMAEFSSALSAVHVEVEELSKKGTQKTGTNRIILRDQEGREIEKSFDADISDSTSLYLKNMIDEALDEFGDSLEMSQKVAVLVQAIEGLLG
jgi:hypothetical protein